MIETIKEFSLKHPHADIVNYDAKELFDYGLTYRTNKNSLEKFRKCNGKYIDYPNIQPYLEANSKSDYELFIIYNRKMYQLIKSGDLSYKIVREVEDINPKIYMDDVFFDKKNLKESSNRSNEPIYKIIN